MTYLSFTRNFEDVIINRVFNGIENGFYVDVGAYQPIADSNRFRRRVWPSGSRVPAI